jgi:hypothetical protein
VNVGFVFVPEVLQSGQHRRHRRVAERAQRLPRDVLRDARQQVQIAHLPFAAFDAAQDLVQPVRPLAARRAFPARLVTVEVEQILRQPHHAGRIVEHDDAGRAEERPRLLHAVEARLGVELVREQDRHR